MIRCSYCNKPAELITGKILYPHIYNLYDRHFYFCGTCEAWVGTHEKTLKPLGTLAKSDLRRLRSKVHSLIDPIWKNKKLDRTTVYKRLSKKLGIPKHKCHVGMFDAKLCNEVIKLFKK